MADNKKYEWALPIGTTINGGQYPYEVVDVLGHGGFGITYKVKARVTLHHIKVDVFFALKEYFPTGCWRGENGATMEYSPSLAKDTKTGLKDFITEGNRLQKICNVNPHIVNVNEVFQANGTAYFVMEYLSGGDLRQMVRNNGVPLSEAAMMSILNPIAGAIDAVHQNHILHLDIKPENIVMRLGDDGAPDVPVLIDFGIAVHFDNRGNPTTTNATKGVTPGYSPSEQYAGVKRFDPRLDIYALSATCYYMVTGKDPQEAFEVDHNDLIAELTPLVSKRTCEAIVHGMSLMANQRPPTITEFLKGFEESNALPIGTVIQGTTFRYMIKRVLDERPNYVQYQASIMRDEEQTGGSTTLDLSGTKHRLYNLYQQLDGGSHISGGDGVFWDLPALGKARYESMQYGTQISKTGDLLSDYFMIDGTQYLLLCEGYKAPPKERKPLINWQKAKRLDTPEPSKKNKVLWILLVCLALLGLTAVSVWFLSRSVSPGKEVVQHRKVKGMSIRTSLNEALGGSCSYTGEVDNNNLPNGKGEARFADGSIYNGEFVYGKLEGKAKFTNGDGSNIFEGTFKNDAYHHGKLLDTSTGNYFIGDFKDGEPDFSKGKSYDKSGKVI